MQYIGADTQALIDAGAPFQFYTIFRGTIARTSLDGLIITAEYSSSTSVLAGTAASAHMVIRSKKPTNVSTSDFLGADAEIHWELGQSNTAHFLIYGKVVEASDEGETMRLTIADAFSYAGNKIYVPSESVLCDCTIDDIFTDIADQLGVNNGWHEPTVIPGGASNFLPGTTLRQAAAQCAAVIGCNAIIRRMGWLGVSPIFTPSSRPVKTITPYQGSYRISSKADEIKQIILSKTESAEIDLGNDEHITTTTPVTFPVGSGAPSIIIRTQLAAQSLAEKVHRALANKPFYSGEFECPREVSIEPGDYITVRTPDGDRNMFVSSVIFTIDGGCRTRIEAVNIDSFDQEDTNIRDGVEIAETLGVTAQEALTTLANNLREYKGSVNAAITALRDSIIAKSGETISTTGYVNCSGVLTSSRTIMYLSVPMPKLLGSKTLTVTSCIGGIRYVGGGYISNGSVASDSSNWLTGSGVASVAARGGGSVAVLTITLKSAATPANNTPINGWMSCTFRVN